MGGWIMEVGKMVVYMAFPVTTFFYFNQPQYYEHSVKKLKQELYPPENEENTKQLLELIAEIRERKQLEELKKMAAKHA